MAVSPYIIELAGPSGVGKSTIAAELGRRLARRYRVQFRSRVRRPYVFGILDVARVLRAIVEVRASRRRDAFFAFRSLYEMKRRLAELRATAGVVHVLDEGIFHRSRILCRYVDNAAGYDGVIARFIRSSPPDLVVILDGDLVEIARRRKQRDGRAAGDEQIARDLTSNDRILHIAETVRRQRGIPDILRIHVDSIGTVEACGSHLESQILPRLGAAPGGTAGASGARPDDRARPAAG